MKSKIYVAALATLALAACNNEDLAVNDSLSSKSSVVFNVSVDESGSRAEWSNGYTLKWVADHADRLSFFHGVTNISGSITSAQNAIYKAESVGSEGVVFTTHSMINDGLGIMVYPCDTTFSYKGSNLYVTVPQYQTAESNLLIPFVSNVIKIAKHDKEQGDGAGYAKNYDIALKQVGTQFTLDADWKGETLDAIQALSNAGDIEPIQILSTELYRVGLFNRQTEIKIIDKDPTYETSTRDLFVNQAQADETTNIYTSNSLFTTALKGLDISEFTLLPTNNETANDLDYVKFVTRYGSVTVKKANGKVWYNEGWKVEDYKTVPEGLAELAKNTKYVKTNNPKSKFYGERVGAHMTRHLNVDLANLDMSDVCIVNDKHLHDIILVHDALQEGENVTFTINGDKNGVFEMSMATLNMLNARPEIKITPCTKPGEECTAIRLTGATEVPEFEFLAAIVPTVYLANEATAWTWTGDNKEMTNVEGLVNEGTINIAANSKLGYDTYYYGITNKGTLNVNGLVKQVSDVNNFGTINIAVGAEYVADATVLTNVSYGIKEGEFGKIYNSGILTTSKAASSKIINYGYIENMIGGTANMTYITANETAPAANFASKYDLASNKFGTIMLKNADDNISISNSTAVGFIKYKYTGTEYETPEVCKYNYIIVENHDIAFTAEANEVKFLEITSTGNNIPVITQKTNYLPKLRGFILNGKANVKENNKLVVPAAYVQGTLYVGGLFCISGNPETLPTTENVYFGNSDEDYLRTY